MLRFEMVGREVRRYRYRHRRPPGAVQMRPASNEGLLLEERPAPDPLAGADEDVGRPHSKREYTYSSCLLTIGGKGGLSVDVVDTDEG